MACAGFPQQCDSLAVVCAEIVEERGHGSGHYPMARPVGKRRLVAFVNVEHTTVDACGPIAKQQDHDRREE